MAWCESAVVCRRHPEETPQPGVCPSCLRERLSRITGISRIKNTTSPSSSPSSPAAYYYCYSSASSGGSSPARRRRGHHQIASDIIDSIYLAFHGGNGLTKSRSMAHAPRNGERDDDFVSRKKKGGFWNKLLLRSSRKKAKFWS